MIRTIALAIALAFSLVAVSAAAGPIRPLPMRLRIEGYVGTAPAGVVSLARWVVAVGDRRYSLTVTKLQPGASAKVAYWDILNALEPLPIAMTLMGKRATLATFTGTPDGQKIALTGSFEWRRGPATLLLHDVEALGTPVAAATPQPTGTSR
jgi:hypothetical protein